jgi:uncharacterized repeat protein (TIGR03803 family)
MPKAKAGWISLLAAVGVFAAVPARPAQISVIYNFKGGSDGCAPQGALTNGAGTLYGVTFGGGSGYGTVFAVTQAGVETILHNFQQGDDGGTPMAGMTAAAGKLYGTTTYGGSTDDGTVYSIDPASGRYAHLYTFGRYDGDAKAPSSPLLYYKGLLYGTSEYGGEYNDCSLEGNCGTVFTVTRHGVEKVLYSFSSFGANTPYGSGLIDVHGTLYGTTQGYGCCGAVYSITPGGIEHDIYYFGTQGDTDGRYPTGSLVYRDGYFYGVTSNGGTHGDDNWIGDGTVFLVTPTGAETVIYDFKGRGDGDDPTSGLTYFNGRLWGTTSDKGKGGSGTIFSVNKVGSRKVEYTFTGGLGAGPFLAPLVEVDGELYGTTRNGGPYGCGTLFQVTDTQLR